VNTQARTRGARAVEANVREEIGLVFAHLSPDSVVDNGRRHDCADERRDAEDCEIVARTSYGARAGERRHCSAIAAARPRDSIEADEQAGEDQMHREQRRHETWMNPSREVEEDEVARESATTVVVMVGVATGVASILR
jgi:hypothetical protein